MLCAVCAVGCVLFVRLLFVEWRQYSLALHELCLLYMLLVGSFDGGMESVCGGERCGWLRLDDLLAAVLLTRMRAQTRVRRITSGQLHRDGSSSIAMYVVKLSSATQHITTQHSIRDIRVDMRGEVRCDEVGCGGAVQCSAV